MVVLGRFPIYLCAGLAVASAAAPVFTHNWGWLWASVGWLAACWYVDAASKMAFTLDEIFSLSGQSDEPAE